MNKRIYLLKKIKLVKVKMTMMTLQSPVQYKISIMNKKLIKMKLKKRRRSRAKRRKNKK